MPVLRAIYNGPSFINFVVALIIVLAILATLPEPESSYLAGLVILAMLLIDNRVNGNAGLLGHLANKTQ